MPDPREAAEVPPYAERVLALVEGIPVGRVLAYGDVAELLGVGGPRQVGRVLAAWGGGVPWWRVLRADGTHAPAVAARAAVRLRAEGTPRRPGGAVDMVRARWDGGAVDAARVRGDGGVPGRADGARGGVAGG